MLAEREREKVGGGKEIVHNMLGGKGESHGAAKRPAASRDVVGEGCSDGADLHPTSSFPWSVTLVLGRENVAPMSSPVSRSVVGACVWPLPWDLGLCPLPCPEPG